MATLLKSDGTEQELKPRFGKKFRFEGDLYKVLETKTIQAITLPDKKLMLMDEDAKIGPGPHKPRNEKATALLLRAGGIPGDEVLGDVVLCSKKEM